MKLFLICIVFNAMRSSRLCSESLLSSAIASLSLPWVVTRYPSRDARQSSQDSGGVNPPNQSFMVERLTWLTVADAKVRHFIFRKSAAKSTQRLQHLAMSQIPSFLMEFLPLMVSIAPHLMMP